MARKASAKVGLPLPPRLVHLQATVLFPPAIVRLLGDPVFPASHSEINEKEHRRVDLRKAMLHNLRHEPQEYPFYPLNPEFKGTGGCGMVASDPRQASQGARTRCPDDR